MSDDPTTIEALKERVQAMRDLGVTEWGNIKLGPAPQPEAEAATQQTKSPDEIEQERRLARRAVALAASGSLVRRLVRDQE